MIPAKVILCEYCSGIVPINHEGHTTRPFHATLSSFRQQAGLCSLCTYIRDHMSIEELETSPSDDAALYVRLKEPNEYMEESKWAVLELSIRQSTPVGDITSAHTFSITTCAFDCKLSHNTPSPQC
jgi:hypothetical protein